MEHKTKTFPMLFELIIPKLRYSDLFLTVIEVPNADILIIDPTIHVTRSTVLLALPLIIYSLICLYLKM